MSSYNRVILLGGVTRDIELKYTKGNTAVCDVGMAINDRRKDASGNWIDETTYVDVVCFGRTAEVAGEYVTKGSQILIEGRLKLEQWEQDGQKRSKMKVICDKLQMLGAKGGGAKQERPARSERPATRSKPNEPEYEPAPQGGGDGGGEEIPFALLLPFLLPLISLGATLA